ncbi:MAG: pyrimidine-nucleoside phosphorylase [Oscillospiraceae bacterium]
MRMYDIISDKKEGKKLTKEQITFFVKGYTDGTIPDYQASALLMAICLKGMDNEETAQLTFEMAHSGDVADLSPIDGIKVDKHSTGGVGDKTTLIIAPIVAACGVPVAKMSGRGLGHTGGTLDKLESIPNLSTSIDEEKFFSIVKENGIAVIGQTGNLAPADKKLYALRDVTATVNSIPLISASIMSKKIAAGADCILLDVKTGSGSFMKTIEDSTELAKTMVHIGTSVGRKVIALITNMDVPLGNAIGNSIEVKEAIEVLKGKGPDDLIFVTQHIAANMLVLAGKGSFEQCLDMAKDAVSSGKALEKLKTLVSSQGGDASYIDSPEKFPVSPVIHEIKAPNDGYIKHMDTEKIGITAAILGAGRESKDDKIDYSAGIYLSSKTGDKVAKGDILATLYTSKKDAVSAAEKMYLDALTFCDEKPQKEKLIYAKVSEGNIEKF